MTKINYSVVGKALMHPMQQSILEALVKATQLDSANDLSPNEMSEMVKEDVSAVAYHFKALKDRGWICCVREVPRRGAIEHYYALTPLLVQG